MSDTLPIPSPHKRNGHPIPSHALRFRQNSLLLKKHVREKNWRELKECLSKFYPPNIAHLIESLKPEGRVIVFRLLPYASAAAVFSEMQQESRAKLLEEMGSQYNRELLSNLSPDDRAELFGELPGNVSQDLLGILPPEVRTETLVLLGYPKDSVGRLMTPKFVSVPPDVTVAGAFAHIRKKAPDAETIHTVYVVDKRGALVDELSLRKLLLSKPSQKVVSLLDGNFVSITANEDQEVAIQVAKKYGLFALPVTDSKGIMLGIVTVDDILRVSEKEFTEDMHKSGSVEPLQMNYSEATPLVEYKKRMPWLLFLAFTGSAASLVISQFEEALMVFVALAFFVPVLVGSSGNAGIQSASLVLRAIATGDISADKWLSVLKKELTVGLLLGSTIAIVLYFLGSFISGNPAIGVVVGLSIFFIMIGSIILGGLLPLVLTRFGLDPAVVSGPMITTVIDVIGVIFYFSIAVWWLGV